MRCGCGSGTIRRAVPQATAMPALDVPGFALSAFVIEGGQRLEVVDL